MVKKSELYAYEKGETPWDTSRVESREVNYVEDSIDAVRDAFETVSKLSNHLNWVFNDYDIGRGFNDTTIDEMLESLADFIDTSEQIANVIDAYLPELEEYKKGLIDINKNFVPYERPY